MTDGSFADYVKASALKASGMLGRPTFYTPEMGTEICRRLALGESLRFICHAGDLPDRSTVLRWAMDPAHPFSDQYARAREVQVQALADDVVDIADGARPGEESLARLRIDARKWAVARMAPKAAVDQPPHDKASS